MYNNSISNNLSSSSVNKSKDNLLFCPYSLLGVRNDATKIEIRRSYQRLALLHHPYRSSRKSNLSEQEKKWKFIVISASYETLMDDMARRRYDNNDSKRNNDCIVSSSISNRIGNNHNVRLHSNKNNNCLSSSFIECPKVSLGSGGSCSIHSFETASSYYVDYYNDDDDNSTIHSTSSMIHSSNNIEKIDEGITINDNQYFNNKINQGNALIIRSSSPNSNNSSSAEKLFGGPLHLMYKARNHSVFTDPYELFNTTFQSSLFKAPNNGTVNATDSTNSHGHPQCSTIEKEEREDVPLSYNVVPTSINGPITTTSSVQYEDGTRVSTQYKIMKGRKIIRTETTKVIDPVTQVKSTIVEQNFYDNDDEIDNISSIQKVHENQKCNKVKNYSWICCFNNTATTLDDDKDRQGQKQCHDRKTTNFLFCGIGS